MLFSTAAGHIRPPRRGRPAPRKPRIVDLASLRLKQDSQSIPLPRPQPRRLPPPSLATTALRLPPSALIRTPPRHPSQRPSAHHPRPLPRPTDGVPSLSHGVQGYSSSRKQHRASCPRVLPSVPRELPLPTRAPDVGYVAFAAWRNPEQRTAWLWHGGGNSSLFQRGLTAAPIGI